MLPLQQTDICIATKKRNINKWQNLDNFIGFVFLLEEDLVSKKSIIKIL